MQKYGIAVLTAMIIAFSMSNCKGGQKKSMLGDDVNNYKTEGWIDNNTLQVVAMGAPKADAKGMVKRKTQAKSAALIMAQKRFVEICVGAELKGAEGVLDGESEGVAVAKEFEGAIRGGQIINIAYDSEDNAEVTFRVGGSGLKKRCGAAAEKIQ